MKDHERWWAPIVHFAAHTFVGTVCFLIIALPAVGLSLFVKLFSGAGVSEFTVSVLTFTEHAILLIDAVLFVTYIGATAFKAGKEMFR